ncbi:MAG: carboxypeptidase regulatory-like domain-containing protein [Ignavibacteria bacterium]|jgi:hypothetical protein
MGKVNQQNLFIVFMISLFCVLLLHNCGSESVDAISTEPELVTVIPAFIEGEIIDQTTSLGISDVTITLGEITTSTDSDGKFSIEEELPAGTYNLGFEKEGYLPITKQVELMGEGTSRYFKFLLTEQSTPVTVTPDAAAAFGEDSDDGTIMIDIPAGAVTQSTDVSVTPTLGLFSPVNTEEILTASDAPAQIITFLPLDIVFNMPVKLTSPLTLPEEYITEGIQVLRINPDTGEPEVVGDGTIVDGRIEFEITGGGNYLVKAATSLTHTRETVVENMNIANIGADETPGAARLLDFLDETTVFADEGFSQNLVETVVQLTNSSRNIAYSLSKPSGVSSTAKAFLHVSRLEHTYSDQAGNAVLKVNAADNNASTYSSIQGDIVVWRCIQSSVTHGSWIGGYFWGRSGVQLTADEISALDLPATQSCP